MRAIVHNHSPSVIPFGVTGMPLRPLYHMSAFIGLDVPVFEIRNAGGMTDMLVSNPALGRALAVTLGAQPAALMLSTAPRHTRTSRGSTCTPTSTCRPQIGDAWSTCAAISVE